MPDKAQRISYLIYVYLNNSITPEEKMELDAFIDSSPANAAYFSEITNKNNIETLLAEYGQPDRSRIWQLITEQAPELRRVPLYRQTWWRYTAAAVVVLALGTWLLYSQLSGKPGRNVPAQLTLQNDIAPGGDKATLTLANGKTIVLDNAANGTLVQEGNVNISKLDNNQLTYTLSSPSSPSILSYNIITTPRGGQYQLVLPDGSKVWLNAGSSLRFPTSFSSQGRVVELSGEAYFEIASVYQPALPGGERHKLPFRVSVNLPGNGPADAIEVLGTHFNIMAYKKEEVRTTLTEGSVKLLGGDGQSARLKPGQQGLFPAAGTANGKITINDDVDIEEVLAWKNGLFNFNNASLHTIMEQISRWYDVDVVFETDVDNHYSFELPRNLPVSKILQVLELTKSVHFRIDGKKITVVRAS